VYVRGEEGRQALTLSISFFYFPHILSATEFFIGFSLAQNGRKKNFSFSLITFFSR
jgi:hypothetical protein